MLGAEQKKKVTLLNFNLTTVGLVELSFKRERFSKDSWQKSVI